MFHAEHFLSRLERLSTSEVDIALQLYYDSGLVRALLDAVAPPEGAARVAISLGDPLDGPFIVVTRDGQFVTCLGKGMKPSDLFVVTRGQLDAHSAKIATLRERMALATQLAGRHERPCAHLLRRLVVQADHISREDWLAVSAWEPMLAPIFMDLYLSMGREILEQGPVLRRLRHSGGKFEEAMHAYWNLVHAAGHLLLLATMGGDAKHLDAIAQGDHTARSAMTFALTSTGMVPFIVKGAWAAGRLGKHLLPAYKKSLVEDHAFFDLLDTIFGILAMGRRAKGLRAEIAKALRAAPATAGNSDAALLRQVMGREVKVICEGTAEMLGEEQEDLEENLCAHGRSLLGMTPEDDALDAGDMEIIRTLPLLYYADGITGGKNVLYSLTLIAATARGAPEQFYLPAPIAKLLYRPWEPAFTENLLAPLKAVEKHYRRPAMRKEVPGPNQPCSCGSGRKYKKCCAGAARAEGGRDAGE